MGSLPLQQLPRHHQVLLGDFQVVVHGKAAMVKVQVVIGRCPICGSTTESADDDGLESRRCAAGHEESRYVPADVYYEEESETWRD